MVDLNLLNVGTSISPAENIQKALDSLTSFQNDFNNLDKKIEDTLTNATDTANAAIVAGDKKTPGKIFDPVFGENVLYGYILTSDFMSYCDAKPLARVGDLVFVVGVVGETVVAEIGQITSGCMDVRLNAFGSGLPYGGGPGTSCGPAKPLFDINVNVLNPTILEKIDPCVASGDLANCLPDIIKNIMGNCNNPVENFGYNSIDDFKLSDSFKKFGIDHLTKLNNMLKNGICGKSPPAVQIEANLYESPAGICNIPTGDFYKPVSADGGCVSEHMKYLSTKLDSNLGFISNGGDSVFGGQKFSNTIAGYVSKEDIELISQVQDIKNYYDDQIKKEAFDAFVKFPTDYPTNSEEALNLALKTAEEFVDLSGNKYKTLSSISSAIQDMKELQNKFKKVIDNPIESIKKWMEDDPDMQRFFGELLSARDNALIHLIPPPPTSTVVCPENVVSEECSDIVQLQTEVRDGVKKLVELINGTPTKNGLISKSMINAGLGNIKVATGAAGMDPIDSMTMFRLDGLDKILGCIQQTLSVKEYFNYSQSASSDLMNMWAQFIALFNASPRDTFGNIITVAPLTAMLAEIERTCVTLPQREVESFALEIEQMGSDIRQFNFISMDPNVVGSNPPLATMLSNPAVLIPIANAGTILSSSQAAIEQSYQNFLLIGQHLSTVIPTKEAALSEMQLYMDNIVQMGIDSLKSLLGCIPPLPCIDFSNLFNFDTALDFGVGFPFKLNIPVLDLTFPTNFNFNIPIVLPDIVAPTGFKAAIGVQLPKLTLPRIPEPPIFPPALPLPNLRLPNLNVPFDLQSLLDLLPKFPNSLYTIPIPQIKVPTLPALIIPPIKIKLPKLSFRLGGYPLPKLDIRLPPFPITLGLQIPISFNLTIPLPSLDLQLPDIELPFIKIPKLRIEIPKLTLPTLPVLTFNIPQLGIPFPAITIPKLCGDGGSSLEEIIAQGKNTYNRLLNAGVSGGRPLAVANCSLWVSPHFRGWIAPVPCSAYATEFSKCMCLK